jgi:hypothetical protein
MKLLIPVQIGRRRLGEGGFAESAKLEKIIRADLCGMGAVPLKEVFRKGR